MYLSRLFKNVARCIVLMRVSLASARRDEVQQFATGLSSTPEGTSHAI